MAQLASPDSPALPPDAVVFSSPYIALWVDGCRIFAPFPDTPQGLSEARTLLLDQWNAIRVPLHCPVSAIQALEAQFFIRRIVPGQPDECLCTLQQAIQHST